MPVSASAPFGIFAYLWALSALFDLIPRSAWLDSPAHVLLACGAVFLMLRPTSLAGFALFNILRLAAFAQDSPHTPNHQVLFAVASAAILGSALPMLWHERKAARPSALLLDQQTWLAAFAPLLRLLVLGLYCFAVLHKLNWAYFDPSVSCAVNTFGRLSPSWLWAIYPKGDPAAYLLIFGSLAAEAGIPILLCFGRTRLLGFAAGVLFHSFLGLGYFHFSTGLFGLYCLFIPPQAMGAALLRVERWRRNINWRERLTTPAALGLLALALVAAMVVMREVDRPIYRQLRYVWMAGVLGGLGLLVLVPAEWRHWRESARGQLRDARLGLVFPIALVFFGMAPYLGLRTVPAFSMFSNLRTEGGITNHLFMPASALHVATYQDDLVRIEVTDRPALKRWADKGNLRTFYDLRAEVQKLVREEGPRPAIFLQIDRAGTRYTFRNAGENPELMAEFSWFERHWMNFRPVPRERQGCSW